MVEGKARVGADDWEVVARPGGGVSEAVLGVGQPTTYDVEGVRPPRRFEIARYHDRSRRFSNCCRVDQGEPLDAQVGFERRSGVLDGEANELHDGRSNADLDRQINDVRSEISGLNQQVSSTQGELTRVQDDLERVRFPETYTVVRGDCLWNIAKKDYIYNDPFKWPRIYEANKDKIKDPDLIYPRQVFTIIRP